MRRCVIAWWNIGGVVSGKTGKRRIARRGKSRSIDAERRKYCREERCGGGGASTGDIPGISFYSSMAGVI